MAKNKRVFRTHKDCVKCKFGINYSGQLCWDKDKENQRVPKNRDCYTDNNYFQPIPPKSEHRP
jgi:hypothetical protein